ncbi:pilus assembly protein TadG-related protein [Methylomarinum sp. Ch1-1]|uniref:Pilus assembly protein TadG-related protein n=1 Tax=Methylomarinum roseum TaxID=3067653 RepID=A0AAU7NT03_9GAMM|nr:pilus assembly protein TadG-related protein [Methylomarinum sp. Ch1-1]MDP4519870.1 pilus assembly protein TadG-related protein [Methylomarinum sp. Ch1-1]
MNARINKIPKKEKGAVLVFTALALVLLVAMAGLAIDISHAYVNKTRLQNLADALALSAAISLAKQESSSTIPDVETFAENFARNNTFPAFTGSDGNGEVASGISGAELAFTFSKKTPISANAADWGAAGAVDDAIFARVVVSPMSIGTWFMSVLSIMIPGDFSQMTVAATAVAGTAPIAPCDLTPIMMCTDNPSAPDTDCSDGECYGYTMDNLYCMSAEISSGTGGAPSRCAATHNSQYGAGNIGLANFGSAFPDAGLDNGANTVKKCLAGAPECKKLCEVPSPGTIPSKTGVDWGPLREGLGSLFNEDSPDLGYTSDKLTGLGTTTSPTTEDTYLDYSDLEAEFGASYVVPTAGISLSGTGLVDPYAKYESLKGQGTVDSDISPDAEYGKRILGVPFVDCTEFGTGGTADLPVKGYGCFYLSALPEKNGSEVFILGQFVGDEVCRATGDLTSVDDFGFYKVILYKDPMGGHS